MSRELDQLPFEMQPGEEVQAISYSRAFGNGMSGSGIVLRVLQGVGEKEGGGIASLR